MGKIITTRWGDPGAQIVTLTLSNPKELNALTTEMQLQLVEEVEKAGADDTVRAVMIRGEGRQAFSSGGSMESLAEIRTIEDGEAMYRRGTRIRDSIMALRKPVVAAVSGWCIGGGFEIALACDMIYAAENARFGMTEVNIGLVPGWGGAIRLPRRTNLIRAKEMLLLGTKLPARVAYEQGVINRVFPDERLFSEVEHILRELAQKPPLAIEGIKEILSMGVLDTGFEEARMIERELSVNLMDSYDFHEAVDAFRHKRKPQFEGR